MRASQFKNLLADLHSLSSEQLADLRAEADRLHQRTHALGSLDAAMIGAGCPHCNSFKYTKNGLGRGVQRYRCKDCAQTFNVSVVNEFAGLIFMIGDGRDGRAGGSTSANGAGISTGAVGF